MCDNNPSEELLHTIQLLTQEDKWHGCKKLPVGMMQWWINAYNAADAGDRITTIYRDWTIPAVTTAKIPDNVEFATWALNNPFTWSAYSRSFPAENTEIASITLNALQLRAHGEQVESKLVQVWRWNPLDYSRIPGRPPEAKLISRDGSVLAWTQQRRAKLAREVLAGKTSIKLEDFAILMVGRIPRSSTGLQAMRNSLTKAGWIYDATLKMWKPLT